MRTQTSDRTTKTQGHLYKNMTQRPQTQALHRHQINKDPETPKLKKISQINSIDAEMSESEVTDKRT